MTAKIPKVPGSGKNAKATVPGKGTGDQRTRKTGPATGSASVGRSPAAPGKKKPIAGEGSTKENDWLRKENETLREENRELADTLQAIRSGEVDAIVVPDGEGHRVYTLEGPDHPYRALVENIREGALTLAHNGTILYTNTRFAEMIDQSADKVTSTSLLDHICPEYKAGVASAIAGILDRPCRSRVRLHKGKGSVPVFLSMNPLSADPDTRISVVVTDRRKDEEQLRLQSRMLDAVADAVIAADPAGKIIYWNEAATRTYGWKPEEAIGKDLVSVAVPELSVAESRAILARLMKGESWTGEYTVKHLDGHTFPIYASDSPVFDDDGKLVAVLGASHDISERKASEEELHQKNEELVEIAEELRQSNEELAVGEKNLRESEARIRSIVENSRDVIYRIDFRTGRYEYISPAAKTITGYDPEELMKLDRNGTIAMVHPDDQTAFREFISRMERDGVADGEYRQRTKDGRYVWVSNHISLVTDETGAPAFRIGTLRNISVRKEAEEILRQRNEELTDREHKLSEALNEKEALLSEIHHRVKNNLSAFISLLSLEGSYDNTPVGIALKTDLQNRARSMALIHETLYRTHNFSNVEMHVYLTTLVDQIMRTYKSAVSIKTEVRAENITLDLGRATPTGLIVNELVTNSLKYAFPAEAKIKAPAITITMTKKDGTYILSVKDNGVGLPSDFNINSTQTLGIKLVNFLARHQMRAAVSFTTSEGAGFEFRFSDDARRPE